MNAFFGAVIEAETGEFSISFAFTDTKQLAVNPLDASAVMRALPSLFAVTTPLAETSATFSSELRQSTVRLEAFAGRTVAVSFVLSPSVEESDVLSKLTDAGYTISAPERE